MLVEQKDTGDKVVMPLLNEFGQSWLSWSKGDLIQLNELNEKTLGVSQEKPDSDEETGSNYDKHLQQIMARFANFGQALADNDSSDSDNCSGDGGDLAGVKPKVSVTSQGIQAFEQVLEDDDSDEYDD